MPSSGPPTAGARGGVDVDQCGWALPGVGWRLGNKVCVVRIKSGVGELQERRRLWLVGTALMALAPARFATAALMNPIPINPNLADAVHGALLTPPAWLVQLVGPIDQTLRTSGWQVLPAMVVLFFLLRMWFGYGRRLFKPVPADQR